MVSPRLGDEKWEMTTMSIPQNEQRRLKKDIKDSARDRVFKDIRASVEGVMGPVQIQGDDELKKQRDAFFDGLRTLVDTYATVETTPLTKERMNEAWARMKKNA